MSIRDFFAGKNIFLTGGSGFVGKILIEKFLRSCPEIGNIYVLIRGKKGKTAQERWEEVTKNCIFDVLKEILPDNLKKVIPIEGNMNELGLGINEEDRKTLINNVNIIYHMAATVRFDDSLRNAVFTNIRSTREIIQLAKELKIFLLFVHVSTTYSNCDRLIVEEEVYPSHGNWKDVIEFVEETDPQIVETMTLKYIHPHPNTYTYTKSLAEQAVVSLCKGQIPAVIVRPSIVISTVKDPIGGWNDNLNGPVGIMIATGKGLLRISLNKPDALLDYIPVDIVGRFLVVVAAETCKNSNTETVEVYNVSKYKDAPSTNHDLQEMGVKLIEDVPLSQLLWYPRISGTTCWYNYYFQVLLFHMLPALFFDIALKIGGVKPFFLNVQRKIYIANTVLHYFMVREFQFINNKSAAMLRSLSSQNKIEFGVEGFEFQTQEQIYEYFKTCTIFTGKMLFNDDFSDIEKNRRHLWRLWLLDISVKGIGISILIYFFIKHNILMYIAEGVVNYFANL